MNCCCEMKGFLRYLILWNIGRQPMTGAKLAKELEKRKGVRPSPGTIYPALKELAKKGLISSAPGKSYTLTPEGKKQLKIACESFCNIFYDMKDMACCCKSKF